MATFNVSNASELTTALGSAVGGDEIVLADGNYGSRTITANYGSYLTIRAANQYQAVFTWINNSGADYVQWDGIRATQIVCQNGCTNIRIFNGRFDFSQGGATRYNVNWNEPVFIQNSDFIDIYGNVVGGAGTGTINGVIFDASDNCKLRENYIHETTSDFWRVDNGCADPEVTDNVFFDHLPGELSHPDGAQCGVGAAPIRLIYRGNIYYDNGTTGWTATYMHGTHLRSIGGPDGYIGQNLIFTGQSTTWEWAGGDGIAENNSMMYGISNAGGTGDGGGINALGDWSGWTLRNNVIRAIDLNSNSSPPTLTGNHQFGPGLGTDLSTLYQGGNDGSDWANFLPVPGSPIENIGAIGRLAEIQAGTRVRAIELAIANGKTMTAPGAGSGAPGETVQMTWTATVGELVTEDGTFKVYVNQEPTTGGSAPADPAIHKGMEIADGGLVEGVAPLPLMVVVDDFANFATNDPRELRIEVDYGERYEAQYHDPVNFPAELTMPQGSTLGHYPGFVSGHSLRGTDMSGDPVLTPGNVQVDNTVTVTVSDGVQTRQVSFTARLYHPDVYYTDRTKATYFTAAPEANRRGIVYFSRDGDFTGALPQQAQTTTQGGIWHYHKPDGIITEFTWEGDETANGGPNFPFTSGNIGCIDIRLKGGESWFVNKELTPQGNNSRITSWGTGQAILDGERIRRWVGRRSIFSINGFGSTGLRIDNVHLYCSDYDPQSIERRDWWNILPYTGKSGPGFGENTGGNTTNLDGEIVTNGNGVYAQIIGDDGANLIVRQVVDNSEPNADEAQPATFTDGDTLTGLTTGTMATFVAAGSRQDRPVRWPATGVTIMDMDNPLIDRCQISGATIGIAAFGRSGLVHDTWIRNWSDYGYFGGGNSFRWAAMSGCALTQPVGFVSEPRDFGVAVAAAREEWNIMRLDDPSQPMPNAPAHTAHRHAFSLMASYHRNKVHSYGGHGADHQPVFRMATNGQEGENQFYCVFFGNGISGGGLPINFGTAVGGVYPYTARGLLIEANHLLGQDTSFGSLLALSYTGTTVRNNLLEYPTGIDFGRPGCGFVGMNGDSYGVDPDENPKSIDISFNTFVFDADNGLATNDVGVQGADLRGNPVTWANNAYAIAPAKVGSISADVTAINDALADFDASWRPGVDAIAYQSASPPYPAKDASGADRPASDVSAGAFEPAA